MVDGEAYGLLRLVIALNDNVTRDPARTPGSLVGSQHCAPAQCAAAGESSAGKRNGIVFRYIGPCDCHESIEFGHLPSHIADCDSLFNTVCKAQTYRVRNALNHLKDLIP
jgi:hypothetical protein